MVAAVAAMVGLSACHPSDGYEFEEKQTTRPQVEISIKEYDNSDEIQKSAKHFGLKTDNGTTVNAFNVYYTEDNHCVIHVMNPEVSYRPVDVGHETLHCIYGDWHPTKTKEYES